ncbi:MAG: hypothetical protein HRT53_06820 [Colwellia sp.]|nr:hypothetical protein [Colwellia sp.]
MNKLFTFGLFIILVTSSVLAKETILPAKFENNQIFLVPTLPDNTQIRFFTDTGGGYNAISKELYEIYKWPTLVKIDGKDKVVLSAMPNFQEGKSIPKGGTNNFMEGHLFIESQENISKTSKVDGFLGGRWHAEKIIKFDYINQSMAIYDSIDDVGIEQYHFLKLGFQKQDEQYTYAFPSIEIKVLDTIFPMLFDTGATAKLSNEAKIILESNSTEIGTSYIVSSIFDKWRNENPKWQVIENADLLSGEAMIKVPEIQIGSITVGPVWFTRRADENFHDFMSSMMDRKVEGAVGGSLLKYLQVVIDYPKEIAYVSDKNH